MKDIDKTKEQLVKELEELRAESRKTGHKLRQGEEAWKSLTQNSPNHIMLVGLDYKIQFINHTVPDLTREQVIGKSVLDFVPPESHQVAIDCFERVKKTGNTNGYQIEYITGENITEYFDVRVSSIRDKDGNITGLISTSNNISNRKIAEQVLQKQNEFLNVITESLTYPYFVINANDYTIAMANSAVGPGIEINKSTCHKITHNSAEPCHGLEHKCPLEIVKKTKKPTTVEHIHFDKDGKKRKIEISAYPILDKMGNVAQMIEYLIDVTERKQAEEALRKSEEKYRFVYENALVGIGISDSSGNILEANETMCKLLGYTQEELSKVRLVETFVNLENRKTILEKLRKDGKIEGYEIQLYNKNREIYWASLSATSINYENHASILTTVIDITERKQAEEALRSSEELYKNIFNNSPLGILHFDVNGVITDCNDELVRILGSTREKVVGLNMKKQIRDPKMVDAILSTLKTGSGYYNDYYTSVTGNKTSALVVRYRAIYDLNNHIIAGMGIVDDITEHKQAEDKLQKSEEKYRLMTTNTLDTIWTIDTEFNLTFVNSAIFNFLGYTPEEFIGLNPTVFTTPEGIKAIQNAAQQLVARYKKGELSQTTFELQQIKKDGTLIDVGISTNILLNKKGKFIGFQGRSIDITQRKQTENALKESEQRFRTFFEQGLIGMAITSLEKGWIEVNDILCRMLGYSREEILRMTWTELTHPEDIEPDLVQFRRMLAGEIKSYTIEKRFIHKTGRIVHTAISVNAQLKANSREVENVLAILHDITERKKAEAELTKLSTAIQQSPSVIAITDLQGNIEYVNPKFTELTGYTLEETKGKNPNILKSGELSDEMYIEFWKTISLGNEWRGEFHNRKKNGELFWEAASVSPIFDKQGKITNYLKVAEDITQRKLAVVELMQSEKRFKRLFDDLGDAVFVTKIGGKNRGRILEVNSAAVKQTGYTKDELLKMNIIGDLYISGSGDISAENWEEKLLKGEIVSTVEKKRKKDGTEFWTEVTVSQIDFKGKKACLSINHDITKSRRAAQIQKVIYNISNAVVSTDNLEKFIILVKKELGSIIDTTNFYVTLYNKKTNTFSLPFHADIKDNFETIPAGKSLTAYVIKTKKPLLATTEVKNKLEKLGNVELVGADSKVWLGVPLLLKKEVIGAFAVQSYENEKAYDKSDMEMLQIVSHQISISLYRKKAEEELKAALNKALESDRLKSAFLSNMSHEIRTPMNGILGFIDLLNKPGQSTIKKNEFTKIIQKSSDRLLNTINDLIDISKIEAGQMKVSNTKTFINNLFDELFAFFNPEANAKGLSLISLPTLSDDKAIVFTDNDKLHGILTNLIKNAIKYTKYGRITFGYEQEGDFIKFYVKDTGIGVPKNRQQAIFNRFEQADIEDVKVLEGSGLGLAIANAYVEMLGGKMWMTSEEGIGSQFMFTIPYKEKTVQITESGQSQTGKFQTEIVTGNLVALVAEDEEVGILYFEAILKNMFRKIIYVKTGKEAIEICKDNPEIDIVLMDIKMPVMNGYDATREIRKFNKDLIIIAQTAYAQVGDKEKALEAGCNDYISKPIEKEILIGKIMELIKNYSNR